MKDLDLTNITTEAEYYELRGCKSKKAYEDRQSAKKKAKYLTKLDHGKRSRVHAYKCQWHPHYHVGHYKQPKNAI